MAFTDYEKFVTTWQSLSTLKEVMDALSLSKHQVETISRKLRKLGINLKKYSTNPIAQLTGDRIDKLKELCNGTAEIRSVGRRGSAPDGEPGSSQDS